MIQNIKSILIVIIYFCLCGAMPAPETKTIKATLYWEWSQVIHEDMHACCKGFCGTNLKVSSVLKDKSGLDYGASKMTDDNYQTTWAEGKEGDGIGEYLEFNYEYDSKYKEAAEGACKYKDEFFILNGLQYEPDLWQMNNRVKKMKMYIDNKFYCNIELLDKMGVQSMKLGFLKWLGKKKAKIKIKLVIAEVYKGSKYSDTCISELYW